MQINYKIIKIAMLIFGIIFQISLVAMEQKESELQEISVQNATNKLIKIYIKKYRKPGLVVSDLRKGMSLSDFTQVLNSKKIQRHQEEIISLAYNKDSEENKDWNYYVTVEDCEQRKDGKRFSLEDLITARGNVWKIELDKNGRPGFNNSDISESESIFIANQ